MLLAFARGAGYTPGVNVRGAQADTTWLHMLPSLALGRVVCAGSPSPGTLAALEPLAEEVRVVTGEPADVADATLALVAGSAAVPSGIERLIGRGGAVYAEPGAAAAVLAGAPPDRVVELGPGPAASDAAPAAGGVTAWLVPPTAPAPESPAARAARRAGIAVRRAVRFPARAQAPAAPMLRVTGVRPDLAVAPSGRGVLLRAAGGDPRLPPPWLVEAGSQAGCDLERLDWSLATPRGYRSQKVVWHFGGGDGRPPLVVKVTQDPAFNDRLDNEHRSLEALAGAGGRAPRPRFRTEHAGLVVVGQERLAGRPFRAASSGTPDCPVAASAVRTLLEVGARGLRHFPAAEVAAALSELAARCHEIYGSGEAVRAALARVLDTLAAVREPLPTGFMHGDPTTLNMIVGDDGTVALVDWENGEQHGLPAFDLLYFLNSYAAWAAETRGPRQTPRRLARRFLQDTVWRSKLLEHLPPDVPRAALPGLLAGYWVVMALREATRLPRARLSSGTAIRTLAHLTGALAR